MTQTRPLFEERLFLVTPPNSAFSRRKVVSLSELAGLDLVLPTRGQGVRARVARALQDAGHASARVAAEIDSHTVIKQAVADGLGMTILSWASVEAEVKQGRLKAVEIGRSAIARVAHLCWSAQATRSRASECVQQELVTAVREEIRRPSWRGVRFFEGEAHSDTERG